jgi:uncharacterized membrane protein YphA (DoxX/SURF4 family)
LLKNNLSTLLLRIGLAIVFTYATVSSFKNPQDWIGYIPQFAKDAISGNILLKLFSIYELSLALWLLSGKYVKYAATLAAITLSVIIVLILAYLPSRFVILRLSLLA